MYRSSSKVYLSTVPARIRRRPQDRSADSCHCVDVHSNCGENVGVLDFLFYDTVCDVSLATCGSFVFPDFLCFL